MLGAQVDPADLVGLASALIRIPSFKTEETPVARFLAPFFRECDYRVELHEVDPGASRRSPRCPARAAAPVESALLGGQRLSLGAYVTVMMAPTGEAIGRRMPLMSPSLSMPRWTSRGPRAPGRCRCRGSSWASTSRRWSLARS